MCVRPQNTNSSWYIHIGKSNASTLACGRVHFQEEEEKIWFVSLLLYIVRWSNEWKIDGNRNTVFRNEIEKTEKQLQNEGWPRYASMPNISMPDQFE